MSTSLKCRSTSGTANAVNWATVKFWQQIGPDPRNPLSRAVAGRD
ncbi:hypothetical protein ACLB1O_05760 [Escherichia coli]